MSVFAADSSDAAEELAGGIADAIAVRIGSSVPRILVFGRRAQRRLVVNDSNTARQMADAYGAAYVLAGRVTQGLRGRTISYTLYNGATGRALMNRTLSQDSSRALAVEQTVALQVTTQMVGAPKPAERRALERTSTRDAKAYDWYTRGTAARDVGAFERAVQYFREATRLDRSFADAYAGLALADAELLDAGAGATVAPTYTIELRTAANHAMSLDSASALAWRADAHAKLSQSRPPSAWRRSFDRAMAIDPRDPATIEDYGVTLVRTGATEAGRAMLERELPLAPGQGRTIAALARLAVAEHRDAAACTLLNEAIAGEVLYAPAWAQRAVLRARHGDLRFAWADAETATLLGDQRLGESAGAIVDLIARDTSRARDRLTAQWTQVKSSGAVGVIDGTMMARALVAAGQPARALDVLELVRPRGQWLAAALHDQGFDTIRSDRRFRALTPRQ